MTMRFNEILRSVGMATALLVVVVSCSGTADDATQVIFSGDEPNTSAQSDSTAHSPKVDVVPIAELIANFDPFLSQKQGVIDAAVFLVRKYDPGLCYGMPSVVPDSVVASVVSGSPQMVAFVRRNFTVESDFQVFVKLRQLLMVKVRELPDGKYEYYLQDGRCCDILRFHGELELRNNEFFDRQLDRSVENVPC